MRGLTIAFPVSEHSMHYTDNGNEVWSIEFLLQLYLETVGTA